MQISQYYKSFWGMFINVNEKMVAGNADASFPDINFVLFRRWLSCCCLLHHSYGYVFVLYILNQEIMLYV